MRLSNLHKRTISLIIILLMLGLSTPLAAHSITRASSAHLSPPGIPLSETIFASLSSNITDSAIFQGNFSIDTNRPLILSVDFQNNTSYTQEELLETAYSFIGEPFLSYLEPVPLISYTSRGLPRIYLIFQGRNNSNPNGLTLGINALTGRVISYTPRFEHNIEVWPSELQQAAINNDSSPATKEQIQLKLVEFLSSHGYTLPTEMRLLNTFAIPNDMEPMLYKINLAYFAGSITLYDLYQGIEVYMDAISGHIITFKYQCIEIPELELGDLINPDIVHQPIVDEIPGQIEDFEYSHAYLQLFSIGGFPNNHSLRLQLAWALQYNNSNYSPEPWIIYRDAYDGGTLYYTSLMYVHFGPFYIDANYLVMLIPVGSVISAILIYFGLKRFIKS